MACACKSKPIGKGVKQVTKKIYKTEKDAPIHIKKRTVIKRRLK